MKPGYVAAVETILAVAAVN